MALLGFIVHLMSGATLLLFAVRFMRIGIERLWSVQIRRTLSETNSSASLLSKGAGLGLLMQGATVVMLIAAGLAGSGTIPLLSAALLAIGADFGSALAVQVLTLPVQAVGPLAVFVGGSLYLNAAAPGRRNFGRVILGLGMIFFSLSLIRDAVSPLQGFDGTRAILAYLDQDPITAAVLGMCLTLAMHSSLAAVLTALAFASHGELGLLAGLGYVIGCNVGSALLPVWLLRAEQGAAPAVAKSVAVLRISLALICLIILSQGYWLPAIATDLGVDQLLLWTHLGFNAVFLLFAPALTPVLKLFPTVHPSDRSDHIIVPKGERDPQIISAGFTTQVTRMLSLLSKMLDCATGDASDLEKLPALEVRMNDALASLREAYAMLQDTTVEETTNVQQILDFAIRIESCGDLLNGKFSTIRREALRGDFVFTSEGLEEIGSLSEGVRKGLLLAQNVFWSGDVQAAKRLLAHKQEVTRMEADSKSKHLRRLRAGNLLTLGSSDAHLELVAALKAINSKLATIGYAVLDRHGQLTANRLKSADN